MRLLFGASLALVLAATALAQVPGLTLPPSGDNQKASVTQFIGPVQITVDYSSPNVHGGGGKDRRGQIWGKLVPYGMADLGLNGGKLSPWRAGANENTVFTISNDVKIQGQNLPAGRYGLHLIPGQDEWTLIFSKNADIWGSFYYDESEDALRVKTTAKKHEYTEWLTYTFTERKPDNATLELQWEDLAVPMSIKVDNINDIYITKIRKDLKNAVGFDYRGWDAAAQFCVTANTHLDEALVWADKAISGPGGLGVTNFTTLSTKALVLSKMGRDAETKPIMEQAIHLPGATPNEIHQYGRQLLTEKKTAEAMEVFKYNAERNGETWPTNVGLARGYSAAGDLPKALDYAKKALAQAPDTLNRNNLEGIVKTLSEGEPIAN
jgi:Protein of unknown function (DUF2911)